jgi:hypothetical protein
MRLRGGGEATPTSGGLLPGSSDETRGAALLLLRDSCRARCQLTQPNFFLEQMGVAASTATARAGWGGKHLAGGGYGGGRGRKACHHIRTGAFGVGDDLGGSVAAAARRGGSVVDWRGAVLEGEGDRGDPHHRRHYYCGATLATIRRVCAATVGGAGLGAAAAGYSGDGGGGKAAAAAAADEAPVCRFCLEEAEVGVRGGNLITPCACSGSQAHIHARCLRTWWGCTS